MLDFNFNIDYKPGKVNTNADAISRIKLNNIENTSQNAEIFTQHSAEENISDGIRISERALNEFNIQILIDAGVRNNITTETLFKTRKRTTI